MNQTDLAYRKTAVEGASGFGLLISLYDTLVGDLRRAADAQRAHDLEARSKELKHALVIVGFLENWIEPDSGELAGYLVSFYKSLRRTIIDAQVKQSAELLERKMAEVLNLRKVWQQLDHRVAASGPEILPPAEPPRYGNLPTLQMDHAQLSWSA
jgi:flagellar protein FliS